MAAAAAYLNWNKLTEFYDNDFCRVATEVAAQLADVNYVAASTFCSAILSGDTTDTKSWWAFIPGDVAGAALCTATLGASQLWTLVPCYTIMPYLKKKCTRFFYAAQDMPMDEFLNLLDCTQEATPKEDGETCTSWLSTQCKSGVCSNEHFLGRYYCCPDGATTTGGYCKYKCIDGAGHKVPSCLGTPRYPWNRVLAEPTVRLPWSDEPEDVAEVKRIWDRNMREIENSEQCSETCGENVLPERDDAEYLECYKQCKEDLFKPK